MRKVFLDDLPRHENGKHIGHIDWVSSIGLSIKYIYDDYQGEFIIIDRMTDGTVNKIKLKTESGNEVWIAAESLKKCFIRGIINYHNYHYNIGDKVGNLLILSKTEKQRRKNQKKKIKAYECECLMCGYIQVIEEFMLINGTQCSCCSGKIVVEGINDIPTTDPWMIPYFQGGYDEAKEYTSGSDKKIKPKCAYCKKISNKQISISKIKNRGGWSCGCIGGLSYPNRFMREVLNQLEIDYKSEEPVKITNIIRKYDFYIPCCNAFIEMDGGFHYNNNRMSGKTLDEQIKIDKEKDDWANDNEIKMIRIKSYPETYEVIKNNIIASDLANMFDLSNIEWEKCQKHALTLLEKDVCEYFEKYNHPLLTDIAERFVISTSTVRKYLINGTIAGICNYNKEEIIKKGIEKRIETRRNDVNDIYVFNLEKRPLYTFCSASETSRRSVECFGVKLNQSQISKVCREKTYYYKGMLFSYSQKEIDDYIVPLKYVRKIACCKSDGTYITVYNSAREAERNTGIGHDRILLACKGIYKQAGGYVWKFIDELRM